MPVHCSKCGTDHHIDREDDRCESDGCSHSWGFKRISWEAAPTPKALRIRKLLVKHPEMTDEQIARKIGHHGTEGEARVHQERIRLMH